ncbi:MAG: hypothetical protein NTV04_24265 [Deltaproteobacteria bacterium]|nr:hypothetical protein [Deltaproteobacteria bacterium]
MMDLRTDLQGTQAQNILPEVSISELKHFRMSKAAMGLSTTYQNLRCCGCSTTTTGMDDEKIRRSVLCWEDKEGLEEDTREGPGLPKKLRLKSTLFCDGCIHSRSGKTFFSGLGQE